MESPIFESHQSKDNQNSVEHSSSLCLPNIRGTSTDEEKEDKKTNKSNNALFKYLPKEPAVQFSPIKKVQRDNQGRKLISCIFNKSKSE